MGHGWQRRIPTREAGIRVTLPSLSVCGGGFLWQRMRPGGDDWWIRRCGGPRWLKHWSLRCEADPARETGIGVTLSSLLRTLEMWRCHP